MKYIHILKYYRKLPVTLFMTVLFMQTAMASIGIFARDRENFLGEGSDIVSETNVFFPQRENDLYWRTGVFSKVAMFPKAGKVYNLSTKQYNIWIFSINKEKRVKGILRGIGDSSLTIETKRPLPHWQKVGDYYRVSISEIEKVAFLRKNQPIRVMLKAIALFISINIAFYFLLVATTKKEDRVGAGIGFVFLWLFSIPIILILGLVFGFRKKKFRWRGKQQMFESVREALKKYVRQ